MSDLPTTAQGGSLGRNIAAPGQPPTYWGPDGRLVNADGRPLSESANTGSATTSNAPAAPQKPVTVKDVVAQEWLNAGYPPAAVAGIMRRVGAESGFDPFKLGDYVNGQPTSVSLYQHHADRAQKLAQYLQTNGVTDGSDPIKMAQLTTRFAIEEMNGGDKIAARAKAALMNPNISEGDAYGLFTRSFERPKNPDGTSAPGSEETNLHTNTFGPFNQMAQGILSQWQKDVTKRGAEYDSALAESKDIHAASRAALAQWQEEGNHPPQNMREAWSQWGIVASSLAAFGGLFGRNHVAALNAAGEMMQAANQADQRSYDRAYIQWKDHLDRGLKLVEMLDKEAHDIVDDAKKSYDQKVAELSILSNAYVLQQQLNPNSVENLSKNIQLSQQYRNLIESQKEGNDRDRAKLETDQAVAAKDAAALEQHPEWGGTIPPDVHSKHVGEVTMERRTGTTPANTTGKARQALIDSETARLDADYAQKNPGASAEDKAAQHYQNALIVEKQIGSATRQPRSAPAMALQQFVEEVTKETGKPPTAQQIRNFIAGTAEQTSEARAVGTRSASLEMAGNVAEALVPLVKESSHKIDRTSYPDINSLILAWQQKTGGEEVVRLGEMVNSLRYAYGRALSPTGQVRVEDLKRSDEILNKAWSAGQIDAALDQMLKTISVERNAIAKTREDVRSGGVGAAPPASTQAVPKGIPAGSKQIGTKDGKAVWQAPDGSKWQE